MKKHKQPASNGVRFYSSYNFVNKDPVIDAIRTIVQDEKVSYADVNRGSGVSSSTLSGWFDGAVRRPQYATAAAVIRSLGYDFMIVRSNSIVGVNRRGRLAKAPHIDTTTRKTSTR